MTVKEKIFELAQSLIDASGGKLLMAFNEKDETSEPDKEAAHFLKYKGKRLGRDLELYNFMTELMGEASMLAQLLLEIVMPLQKEYWHKLGAGYLMNWGCEVNEPENIEAWKELFVFNP